MSSVCIMYRNELTLRLHLYQHLKRHMARVKLSGRVMNRIREIREAAGLSSDELGALCVPPTSGAQIRRLETEDRNLTAEWMERIAIALKCTPADLIANAVIAEVRNEVEPAANEGSMAPVVAALATRGLRIYKVTEHGNSVARAGIGPGDMITVDETPERIKARRSLDMVLVRFGDEPEIVLRMFIAPDLLITNRSGANLSITTEDPVVKPTIVGVIVRDS